MDSAASLKASLEERFGLRNIRTEWIRRQTALSPDIIAGPICRADICEITEGTLPWNVLEAHSVQLNTKVLAQVEDIINIASADPRSDKNPIVLQLTLTDGYTDFVAVELEPLQRLSIRTVPGTKIILHPTALVRRGRVFLTAKDFTFLGPPSSNIWGNSYQEKIASALDAVGLPNPNASTFDSITRTVAQNGGIVRTFRDLGGISDPTMLSGDGDDDDDFWAEAAQLADRSEVINTSARSHPSDRRAEVNTDASPEREAVRTDPLVSAAEPIHNETRMSVPVVRSDMPQVSTEHVEPIIIDDDSGNGIAIIDVNDVRIPEMPVLDSDPVGLVDNFDTTAARPSTANRMQIDTEVNDLEIPKIPLSRLEHLSRVRDSRATTSLYRAFVTKSIGKQQLMEPRGDASFSVSFDDGTAIESLTVNKRLAQQFGEAFVLQTNPSQRMKSNPEGGGLVERTSHSRMALGTTGFIAVCNDRNGSVSSISNEPPGGYATFLSAYADNVEARLARLLLHDAN